MTVTIRYSNHNIENATVPFAIFAESNPTKARKDIIILINKWTFANMNTLLTKIFNFNEHLHFAVTVLCTNKH